VITVLQLTETRETMTKREIAILLFKVLSIDVFIRVIDDMYYALGSINSSENISVNLATIIFPKLLFILCGIVLWHVAPKLADSVFQSSSVACEPNASLTDIQSVAFIVVGLFLFASSLKEIVGIIITYNTMWVIGSREALINYIIVLSIKIIFSSWLLLGSHVFVNFIFSTRHD
jgi:hypothetical protein